MSFFFIKVVKVLLLIRQVTNNECMRGNETIISQYLSFLVSRDPCCCLSSKKLIWLNFLLKFQVFKFSYASAFFKNFWTLPMICKYSPVEVSLFQRKKWSQNRKRLLFGVRVAKGKKIFLLAFLISKIPDLWWNPDFTKFLPVMHFQI